MEKKGKEGDKFETWAVSQRYGGTYINAIGQATKIDGAAPLASVLAETCVPPRVSPRRVFLSVVALRA